MFQVLDDYETRFPFQDLTRFEGLEQIPDLLTDPRALRAGYLRAFERFRERMTKGCRGNKIDYILLNTKQPLDKAMTAYLANRARRRRK